ncbi:MAG TPA: hypothetical protein VFK30_06330, partial [Anaerolineae bacterium]|nr:hypothetical protein [Anaerolineae bacterium]
GTSRTPKLLLESATDNLQVITAVEDRTARSRLPAVNNGYQAASGKPQVEKRPVASVQRGVTKHLPVVSDQAPSSEIKNQKTEIRDYFSDDREWNDEVDPFSGMSDEVPTEIVDRSIDIADRIEQAGPLFAESKGSYPSSVQPPAPVSPPIEKRPGVVSTPATQTAPAAVPRNQPAEPTPAPKHNGSNGNGRANGHARHKLTRIAKVVISRTGDGPTDAARIGEVHHLLQSAAGDDRFCFIVQSHHGQMKLDFPNDTTDLNPGLVDRLRLVPGVESVQISNA